jgi:hypothetical protein
MKLLILKIWISSIVLIIVITNTVSAQSFYTSINAGYGFMVSGMNGYGADMFNKKTDEKGRYREAIDFSLGEGIYFGLDLGYKITEHIGAEIGLSYLKGEIYNFETSDLETVFDERSIRGEIYRINPSLVISATEAMFTPFAKFGVVFGFGTINHTYKAGTNEQDFKASEGMSIGVSGALGVEFKFLDNFSCFIQANSINMSYFPEKGEVTKWIENGKDVLAEKSVSEKQVKFTNKIYEDQIGPDPNPNQDPNQPREGLGTSYPFESFGINLGVKLRF